MSILIKQGKGCKLEKRGNAFLLILGDPSNRKDHHLLDPSVISSIRELLGCAKDKATDRSVLITAAEGESFCQGFDFKYAEAEDSDEASHIKRFTEMIDLFKNVVADLISLPMPTIAAINGYATGAGLMLAISHDYLTMAPGIRSLRSSHLSMKMSLPPYFAALLRSKVGSPLARRRLVLRDLSFDSMDAVEIGLFEHKDVDCRKETNATNAAMKLAGDLSAAERDGKVYAELRKDLYPELCKALGLASTTILPRPPRNRTKRQNNKT